MARALVKQPKILLMEDPLDHFHAAEAEQIMHFLTAAEQPWSLIMVSNNAAWKAHCNKHITISNGIMAIHKG